MTPSKHLVAGPISPAFISDQIAFHQSHVGTGAHSLFLGQVRADDFDGKKVAGIEYSAYPEMVDQAISGIKEKLFHQFDDLKCLHIWHSTGLIKVGEISLLVLISSGHRKEGFPALEQCVEMIKTNLPVWKKEIFEDSSYRWKKS